MPYIKELFYVLSGALIIFSALELIRAGTILAYLNLNWVLILWAFIGIVIVIINRENE